MKHVFELNGEPSYSFVGNELTRVITSSEFLLYIDENRHLVYDGEDYVVSDVTFYEKGKKIILKNRLSFAGGWHFIYENQPVKIPGKSYPSEGRIKIILIDESFYKRPKYWPNGVMYNFGYAQIKNYE